MRSLLDLAFEAFVVGGLGRERGGSGEGRGLLKEGLEEGQKKDTPRVAWRRRRQGERPVRPEPLERKGNGRRGKGVNLSVSALSPLR